MPRLTYSLTTISSVSADQVELTIGCRLTASSTALATSSSGETRTSRQSGRSRSRSSAFIDRVTSTVRNSVTCGAVNADGHHVLGGQLAHALDRDPLLAVGAERRAPRPAAPRRRRRRAAAAACTSSRVIEPGGPVPASAAQVDAQIPGELADRRLGQHRAVPVARAAGAAGGAVPRPAARSRRPGGGRAAGADAAAAAASPWAAVACGGGAWPRRSSGRSRPARRCGRPARDRRSGPARPRRSAGATAAAATAVGGRRQVAGAPGRCRSR